MSLSINNNILNIELFNKVPVAFRGDSILYSSIYLNNHQHGKGSEEGREEGKEGGLGPLREAKLEALTCDDEEIVRRGKLCREHDQTACLLPQVASPR